MDKGVRGGKPAPARGRSKKAFAEAFGSDESGEEDEEEEQSPERRVSTNEREQPRGRGSLTEFQEIENALQPDEEERSTASAKKRRSKQDRLKERSRVEAEEEGVAEGAPLPAELFEGLPPRMVAMVKQKIGALDGEISRFKRENERVLGLKDECEEQMRQFQEDVRDFEHKRGQEIADFNAYKEEEVKRLKREKKELEK